MTKTSLSVGMLFTLGLLASSSGCSSSTPPVPIGGSGGMAPAGGGPGSGGGDPGAGGGTANPNSIALGGSWADLAGNTVGIQGAFYILEDAVKEDVLVVDDLVHSDFDDASSPTPGVIDASTFSEATPEPCIVGTAAKVESPDPAAETPYSEIWGGGIGMNLNEVGGEGSVPMPYNATANGVVGFEFTMTGDVTGAEVRFKATQAGVTEDGDFCKKISPIVPGTPIKVLFSELAHQCWAGGMPTKTLDPTQLEAIQWQVVTSTSTAYSVTNFCVKSLAWVAQ